MNARARDRVEGGEEARTRPRRPENLIGARIGLHAKSAPGEPVPTERRRGRGATLNMAGRFEPYRAEPMDDGWESPDPAGSIRTEVFAERPRRIITRNDSPDLSFDRSINPYRGCEHGCVYCFARPTHAFLGLSPGVDFESKLFFKEGAAELLESELAAPNYVPRTIAIGTNTDPYQPIERSHRVTRGLLEVLARANHPVGIVTKSPLVLRDLDILAPMAKKGLARVAISVTSLDADLARRMEPRAATPQKRLETIRLLAEAGIPTTVLVAPVIPALNDPEIETILTRARAMGAREAGYVMLRLPLELADLFRDWLRENYPDRAKRIMSLVRATRGGKDYDSTFGARMSGDGPYAWLVGRRFEAALARQGYDRERSRLRADLFRPPVRPSAAARAEAARGQLSLF